MAVKGVNRRTETSVWSKSEVEPGASWEAYYPHQRLIDGKQTSQGLGPPAKRVDGNTLRFEYAAFRSDIPVQPTPEISMRHENQPFRMDGVKGYGHRSLIPKMILLGAGAQGCPNRWKSSQLAWHTDLKSAKGKTNAGANPASSAFEK